MTRSFVYLGHLDAGKVLVQRLLDCGLTAASGIEDAQLIVCYFPRLEDTEEACFGSEGVIAKAQPGSYVLNLGPVTPAFAREFSAMAQVSNLHAVEAVLAVGSLVRPDAFERDNLSAVVAGDDADIDAISDVIDALAGRVVRTGQAGSAAAVASARAFRRSASVLACVEAGVLLDLSATVPGELADDAAAALGEPAETVELARAIRQKSFGGSYTCEFLMGELEAAMFTAEEEGLTGPVSEACDYLLRLMCLIGGFDKAPAALSLLYADEEAGARFGLNWEQAEAALAHDHDGCDHDHDHHHHHHHHDDEDYDFDDFDDYDDVDDYDEYSPN